MKRAVIAVLLALASVGMAPPALAQDDLGPVLGLLGGSTSGAQGSEHAVPPADATASTYAPNRRLRRGCHTYWLGYTVQSPTDHWALEVSVIDPRGKAVAALGFISESEDETGRGTYRLCKWATRPGRFKIVGKLTWYDGPLVPNEVTIPVSTFRLRRP